jgi:hypothetical protein
VSYLSRYVTWRICTYDDGLRCEAIRCAAGAIARAGLSWKQRYIKFREEHLDELVISRAAALMSIREISRKVGRAPEVTKVS